MSLFFAMLPVYLFANLHCFGMCGPLVMMIGRHKWRVLYFLGRIASFTLAGFTAGSLGFVLQIFLSAYHVGSLVSYFFGVILIALGLNLIFSLPLPRFHWFEKRLAKANNALSYLILKDQPLPTFLFGFFTILLPCGQSLIVFSACALLGDAYIGALNGFVFALLTTPSLFVAMQLASFFKNYKKLSSQVVGYTSCFVGTIAILRGLADSEVIPHFILSERFHIVIW